MAAIYDALGNVTGDDGLPSTDQMRYELTRKADTPTPVQSNRPLDQAIQTISAVATHVNPLMLLKAGQDVGRIGVNMASPFVGAWAGALSNAQAKGAEYLHRAMGNEAAAKEAQGRMVRLDSPEQAARFTSQLQTPLGQSAMEGASKVFDAFHAPAAGPGSGLPGHAPISPRPFLTPNDVRVMGAEATRVGRQVRDIPTDFSNAQSGFQRIDPITNQPTLGAKLGNVDYQATQAGMRLEKKLDPIVADIMERGGTSAELLSALAGKPMYAVRPQGTMLARPNIPESAKGYDVPYSPVQETITRAVPYAESGLSDEVLYNRVSDKIETPEGRRAHRDYIQARIDEMYPGESKFDAQQSFNAMFYDRDARFAQMRKWTDDFIASPEGKALIGETLPSSQELKDRHDAAISALNGAWGNYIARNVGTEGAPLVKAAAEGLTMLPATQVLDLADMMGSPVVMHNRTLGGMPEQGTFDKSIADKEQELSTLNAQIRDDNIRRNELYDAFLASNPSPEARPRNNPMYAEVDDRIRASEKAKGKLTEQLDNLRLGAAYEKIEDYSVTPRTAKSTLEDLRPPERQFYPSIQKTPPNERVYLAESRLIGDMGFTDAMAKFYDDVMQGKLDKTKLNNFSVEKYVRKFAGERVAKEKAEAKAFAEYPITVQKNLTQRLSSIPEHLTFGNAKVIELNDKTPTAQAIADVSADTAVLDHCIGSGGGARGNKIPHPFTKSERAHWPIIDPATGVKHVNASVDETSYVRNLRNGDELALFRASETGLPVFSLELRRSHIGQDGSSKFNIGWASGANNGVVVPDFKNAIRDYLNSRADSINSTGGNLETNAGVYDMQDSSSARMARRAANVSDDSLRTIDWSSQPRFMTVDDVKAVATGGQSNAALATLPARPAASIANTQQVVPRLPQDTRYEVHTNLTAALDNAVETAIDNANVSDVDRVENRLVHHGRAAMESLGDEDSFIDDPIGRMQAVTQYVENAINRERGRNTEHSHAIADGLDDFLVDVRGIQYELERQVRDLAAQQPAPEAPAPQQFTGAEFDSFVDGIRQNVSGQVAHDVVRISNTVANAMGTNVSRALENRPAEFAARLSEQAATEQNFVLEQVLNDLAAQIEPANSVIGGMVERIRREVGADVAHGVEVALLGVSRNFNPRTNPIDFANEVRLVAGQVDNELVELELHNIAETLDPWQADPTHPANRTEPPTFTDQMAQDMAHELYNDTRRGGGDNVDLNDLASTLQALETGNFDDMRFRGYAPNVQNQIQRDIAHYIRQIMDDVGVQLPAEPTEMVNANLIDDGLQRRVIEETTPDTWPRLNARIDELARRALENNISIEVAQRAIRDRAVDMEGFNPAQREYIAREVGNTMRLNTQTRQVPALNTAAIPESVRNASGEQLVQAASRDGIAQIPPLVQEFVATNSQEQLQQLIAQIRAGRADQWAGFSAAERELLARNLEDHVLSPGDEAEIARLMSDLEQSYHENTDMSGRGSTLHILNHDIRRLRDGHDEGVLGEWANDNTLSPAMRADLISRLEQLLFEIENANDLPPPGQPPEIAPDAPPPRRGPFQPGGSSAVRGLPLGNLNLRPAITAEMLRGPDTQPVRNFMQQVRGLPGVTQEGLRTGLMAFEQMDPTRQMTKAEFVRELLPSSYDIVDLKGASQDNQHLMDMAENALDDDPEYIGQLLGIDDEDDLDAWAKALRAHHNDFDSFPRAVKAVLADQGIEDANTYNMQYDIAYRDALETFVNEHSDTLSDDDGYTYSTVQRLVKPRKSNVYGEFGVVHPDQRGTYHHFDIAPEGVIGHFRGTYNAKKPFTLNPKKQTFKTKPNSYVIEEIQSDAQKLSAQTGHLHQVHGVIFKAAIQKGLESGATTIYLPTAAAIAEVRGGKKMVPKFAPIYDQAIIKEGLKPLLKIPGVTADMVNGYHEISFTPDAIEHILNGQGQTTPGYAKGGPVRGYANGGIVHQIPSVDEMRYALMMRSK